MSPDVQKRIKIGCYTQGTDQKIVLDGVFTMIILVKHSSFGITEWSQY